MDVRKRAASSAVLKGIVLFSLFVFRAAEPLYPFSEESVRFNSLGMGMYDQYNYIAAGESFLRAIDADPENYLAYYNLACSMCLLREEYNPEDFDRERRASFTIYLEDILDNLERAAALDEYRKQRMLEDPDLLCLRGSLRFHRIAGRSLLNPRDLPEILSSVDWRLDEPNAKTQAPPFGSLEFTKEGQFLLRRVDGGRTVTGRYSIQGGLVLFFPVSGPGADERPIAVLGENGAAVSGFSDGPLLLWNDISE